MPRAARVAPAPLTSLPPPPARRFASPACHRLLTAASLHALQVLVLCVQKHQPLLLVCSGHQPVRWPVHHRRRVVSCRKLPPRRKAGGHGARVPAAAAAATAAGPPRLLLHVSLAQRLGRQQTLHPVPHTAPVASCLVTSAAAVLVRQLAMLHPPGCRPRHRRGIFITGSSLVGAAIREPRITSKNLIRRALCLGCARRCSGRAA